MSQLWYLIGFVGNNIIHAEHDFTDQEDANQRARNLYNFGMNIEETHVEFDRVVAISENHEIAFDGKCRKGDL